MKETPKGIIVGSQPSMVKPTILRNQEKPLHCKRKASLRLSFLQYLGVRNGSFSGSGKSGKPSLDQKVRMLTSSENRSGLRNYYEQPGGKTPSALRGNRGRSKRNHPRLMALGAVASRADTKGAGNLEAIQKARLLRKPYLKN